MLSIVEVSKALVISVEVARSLELYSICEVVSSTFEDIDSIVPE